MSVDWPLGPLGPTALLSPVGEDYRPGEKGSSPDKALLGI